MVLIFGSQMAYTAATRAVVCHVVSGLWVFDTHIGGRGWVWIVVLEGSSAKSVMTGTAGSLPVLAMLSCSGGTAVTGTTGADCHRRVADFVAALTRGCCLGPAISQIVTSQAVRAIVDRLLCVIAWQQPGTARWMRGGDRMAIMAGCRSIPVRAIKGVALITDRDV